MASDNIINMIKALSDGNRIKIVEMLMCGEVCACKILENLNVTQPTLSHHMKILTSCNLIKSRKDGQWMRYSVNMDSYEELCQFFNSLKNESNEIKIKCGCC